MYVPSSNLLLACQIKVSWHFFPLFLASSKTFYLLIEFAGEMQTESTNKWFWRMPKREGKSAMKLLLGMPRVGYSTVVHQAVLFVQTPNKNSVWPLKGYGLFALKIFVIFHIIFDSLLIQNDGNTINWHNREAHYR